MADLQRIHDFIAKDSPKQARKVVREMVEKTEVLDEIPRMGKVVPEIKHENVRELHLYSYRILYEIMPAQIEVLGGFWSGGKYGVGCSDEAYDSV